MVRMMGTGLPAAEKSVAQKVAAEKPAPVAAAPAPKPSPAPKPVSRVASYFAR